ncbi:hypothetical protein AYI69_g4959 [Smittium culicis]|uniref:Uncharacterized protein n=1 Tax=Smittium culicis TaxID=133412 RepID=A0A1R1Y980_9FUNG|nr:hypothetical protein AYI69_g4959 [Smittium culicis]
MELRNYELDIVHQAGKIHPADALSKMPWEEVPQELLEEEVLLIEKVTYDTWSQYAKDKVEPPKPQVGWKDTRKKLLWKQGN